MMGRRIKWTDDGLPEPCARCAEYDGNFAQGRRGGLGRCDCARGRTLAGRDRVRVEKFRSPRGPRMVGPVWRPEVERLRQAAGED